MQDTTRGRPSDRPPAIGFLYGAAGATSAGITRYLCNITLTPGGSSDHYRRRLPGRHRRL